MKVKKRPVSFGAGNVTPRYLLRYLAAYGATRIVAARVATRKIVRK